MALSRNAPCFVELQSSKRCKAYCLWPISERSQTYNLGKKKKIHVLSIRVDPSWSDPDWSELIRSDPIRVLYLPDVLLIITSHENDAIHEKKLSLHNFLLFHLRGLEKTCQNRQKLRLQFLESTSNDFSRNIFFATSCLYDAHCRAIILRPAFFVSNKSLFIFCV